jgi:hypothetical protein
MPSETLNQNNSTEKVLIVDNSSGVETALRLTAEGEAAAKSVSCNHAEHNHTCGQECEPVEISADPIPQPGEHKHQVLSRKQLGELRRRYLTIVHGVVRACGHKAKFSSTKQPTNNCVDCWTAYFASTDATGKPIVDLLGVHKLLTEKGVKGLESQYGTKFTKNFHGFLALYLKQQASPETPQEEIAI